MMIVYSKFAFLEALPKYLGPFDSVPYTCHEFGHTWNSSCVGSWKDIFIKGFWFSLKVYAPLYLLGALAKLRNKNVDKKKLTKRTILGILQSTFFLAMTGTWFLFTFCAYGAIFGKYHGLFGLVIGFVSSILSIILERKSRRSLLAVYIFNLALESMFKMAVSRGYVSNINRGEVYLFAATNLVYMALYRGSYLPDDIQNLFAKVFDKEQTGALVAAPTNSPQYRHPVMVFVKNRYDALIRWLNALGPKVISCSHDGSCSAYAAASAIKFFSFGYGIQILLSYQGVLRVLINRDLSLLVKIMSNFSLAKFLCAYTTLFRVVNCFLRRVFGHDHPVFFGGISGFIAGLSSSFYPSTSITMYALSKLFEIITMKAVAAKYLPYFPNFDSFLYSASMALLFHCSLFEPHNIRPSYWKFISGLSGNNYPLMFRILLDKFGTHASKLYPNYVPDLDLKHVKTEEVKRALAFVGKWPYALE